MRRCAKCGTKNPMNFEFCGSCGASLPAVPPQSKGFYLWGIPIPGLLLVPLLACGLCVAVGLMLAVSLPSKDSPSGVPVVAKSTTAPSYRVGDTIRKGNWSYQITQAEKSKSLTYSQYGNTLEPKGIFLLVYLTLTNIGSKNFSINTWDFHLVDSKGIEYTTSSDFGVYSFVSFKKLTRLGDQFVPDLPADTVLVFDVNPNATGWALVLEQANISVDLALP